MCLSEEYLSQKTASLADRDVILGALVPESHVVDAATGKSSDQPTKADQAGNLDDGDCASLLNADAQNHPISNGTTYRYVKRLFTGKEVQHGMYS